MKAKASAREQAWVRSPFARCVRWRESHNGADPNAEGNLYGLEGINVPARFSNLGGTYSWAASVPRSVQDRLAYLLWLRDGDGPWSAYDGCHE